MVSVAESVEGARPAFARSVSDGLDALEPLIGRLGVGAAATGAHGHVVTSALRSYRFAGPGGGGDHDAVHATVVRAAVPAGAVGTLDAALQETVAYARARALYGATVLDIPHARSLLAAALADALTAEALSSAAVRLLDSGASGTVAVAVALSADLTCRLLSDAVQQISVLAGSTFYARIAPFEAIEQHVRDLSALAPLVPELADPLPSALPELAQWCRDTDAAAPRSLARPAVALLIAARAPGATDVHAELAAAVDDVVAAAGAAGAGDGVEPADPHAALDLAHRVALLSAAAAVVDSWAHAPDRDALAADPLAMEACLRRIRGRLARRQPPLPADLVERLVAHAEARAASGGEMAIGSARPTVPPLETERTRPCPHS